MTGLCFGVSAFLSPPASVIRELSRKVSPVFQMRKLVRAFEPQGKTVLKIKARDVDVFVSRSTSESQTSIKVEVEGRFSNDNRDPLRVIDETELLEIRIEENLQRKAWLSNFAGPIRGNRLRLELPASFSGRLVIENDAGLTEISVRALSELDWESVSGNLEVTDSEIFNAKLSSVSGDVAYEAITSNLTANLTSGNSSFKLLGLDRLLAARADLSSISGNLSLAVSRTASLQMQLSSMTGEVTSQPSLSRSKEAGVGRALEGVLGKGANEARLRSVSGNIDLKLID